jgi:hypothetical protein
MILKRLEEIDKNDISNLIDNGVQENKNIEYKSSLPGNSDEDKKEFLADVSSFANAGGGDILYGITESKGLPVDALGIPGDVDEAILRLENILRDGLDPRIHGYKINKIEDFPKGPIIIIRIPISWISPHMVKFKNNSRFFTRNSAGKHQMDTTELRQAFTHSQQTAERMRNFRDARLGKIFSGETPVKMMDYPKLVLHLLPLVSFTTSFCLSAQDMEKEKEYLKLMSQAGYSHRFNLDGFLKYNNLDPPSYCQFFRNGCIESVKGDIVNDLESDRKIIHSAIFSNEVVTSIISYFEAIHRLEISLPVYVFIALLGVKESLLVTQNRRSNFHDRNDNTLFEQWVITPEQEIGDMSQVGNREILLNNLKPLYDVIWNAYGYPYFFE